MMTRTILLASAAMVATFATPALAQSDAPAQAPAAEDAPNASDIVVTGSRIRRQDLAGVGPATVVSAEQIENTGVVNIETVLQRLPANAASVPIAERARNWRRSSLGLFIIAASTAGIATFATPETHQTLHFYNLDVAQACRLSALCGQSQMSIHPTAVVSPKAEIATGCEIGPYCIVGDGVVLGEGCWLQHHVSLNGPSIVGKRNKFFAFTSVGQQSQLSDSFASDFALARTLVPEPMIGIALPLLATVSLRRR